MADRKLRTISEAIDSKNYRQALRLCNAFLEKTPNSPIAKALKALALERSGKAAEAFQECEDIKKMQPPVTDEVTLSTTYIVYRSLGKVEEATVCYENASKAQPTNEDLAQCVFWSYVREFNYQKQQQAAMRLLKQFGKDKYMFWSIISTTLQVPDNVKQHTLLTVAERMLQKYVSDKKVTQPEEILFYLNLLERQDRYDAALEVLESQKSFFKLEEEFLSLRASYLVKLNRTDDAIEAYKNLIEKNPGQFSHYIEYQNLVLQKYPERIDGIKAFFQEIDEKESKRREPLLAKVFLEAKVEGENSKFVEFYVDYVRRFGNKQCCVIDLKPVFSTANSNKEKILALIGELGNVDKDDKVDKVIREATKNKLYKAFGHFNSLSAEEAQSKAKELFDQYLASLSLPGTYEETENRPGDDLLILAAELFVKSYVKNDKKSVQDIIDALSILEYGLAKSKYNYKLKLALISLYTTIKAFQPAQDHYHTLEIKHIQIDTLSYLILDPSIHSCFPEKTQTICESIKHFHGESQKELHELATLPYRHGGYTKVKEFIGFKERLAKSHQLAIAKLEHIYAELTKYQNNQLVKGVLKDANLQNLVNEEKISALIINQDYSVLDKWSESDQLESSSFLSAASYSQPFDRQIKYLKLRGYFLVLLSNLLEKQDELKTNLSAARNLLSELELIKTKDDGTLEVESLSEDQLHWTIRYLLFDLSSLFFSVFAAQGGAEALKTFAERLKQLQSSFEKARATVLASLKTEKFDYAALPLLSSFAQVFGWYRLVSLHWDTLIPAARRKKKGEVDPLQEIAAEAKAKLKEVESQLKESKQAFKSNVAPLLSKPEFFARATASSIAFFGRDENKAAFNKVANDVVATHKEALANFLRLVE